METFDFGLRVDPATAKQDRITFRWETWLASGTRADLEVFEELLGAPPGTETLEEFLNYGEIFNRPQQPQIGLKRYTVTAGGRGRSRRVSRPLFTGQIESFTPLQYRHSRNSLRRLTATIGLNPTRFVVHQDMRLSDEVRRWPEVRLWSRSAITRHINGEFALDGRDNVLLGRRREHFASSQNWPHHLERYLSAVSSQIQATVDTAARHAGVVIENPQASSLRSVETYWEFLTNDALALVSRLEPVLSQIGAESRRREFPLHESVSGSERIRDRNSVSIRSYLTNDVSLRVYAKTPRRIRFEISHERDAARHRSIGSPIELIGRLQHVARDAARRVNSVLRITENRLGRAPFGGSVFGLIQRVCSAAPTAMVAEQLLALLAEQGSLHIGEDDPLREIAISLTKLQVLERRPNSRAPTSFDVTRQFRDSLERLRLLRRPPLA